MQQLQQRVDELGRLEDRRRFLENVPELDAEEAPRSPVRILSLLPHSQTPEASTLGSATCMNADDDLNEIHINICTGPDNYERRAFSQQSVLCC